MLPLLSADILRKVVPNLSQDRAATLADLINKICPTYGIDSADVLHEFLANCAEESWGFRKKEENLNYTAPQLVAVFGKKYFRTMVQAERFAHNPQKIANFVYGGRMGNTLPNSGWNYRGGGFIQMTGYDMFAAYGRRNKMTAMEAAEKVRTDDYWALDSACWVFAIAKGLVPLSRLNTSESFELIVRKINGGTNGLAERKIFLDRARQYIPIAA